MKTHAHQDFSTDEEIKSARFITYPPTQAFKIGNPHIHEPHRKNEGTLNIEDYREATKTDCAKSENTPGAMWMHFWTLHILSQNPKHPKNTTIATRCTYPYAKPN